MSVTFIINLYIMYRHILNITNLSHLFRSNDNKFVKIVFLELLHLQTAYQLSYDIRNLFTIKLLFQFNMNLFNWKLIVTYYMQPSNRIITTCLVSENIMFNNVVESRVSWCRNFEWKFVCVIYKLSLYIVLNWNIYI